MQNIGSYPFTQKFSQAPNFTIVQVYVTPPE